MWEKVVLILVDGMRPDGMTECGNSFVSELLSRSSYSLKAQTVMPSVTLPCHMSLFHSVSPQRHGILTNQYTPQVRPIEGLFDRLDRFEKSCAFFYTWEELRDLSRPDHLKASFCLNQHKNSGTDQAITEAAISYLKAEQPDFLFLYLGETDEVGGHSCGWMSPTYLQCIHNALSCVEKVWKALPSDYTLILTADHGGHDRSHGKDLPEDMTIPVVLCGKAFPPKEFTQPVSILDLAPTVAALLQVPPAKEWEGKSLLS